MSEEKKILDFDNNQLFLSSRILKFLIENTYKLDLNEIFHFKLRQFTSEIDLYNTVLVRKLPLEYLFEFIDLVRKSNISIDQFYKIGNISHEFNSLIFTSIYNNANIEIDWRNEINFLKMSLVSYDQSLKLKINLHKIIKIDFKIRYPFLEEIIKGLLDRMFMIIFGSKASIKANAQILEACYSQVQILNFDLIPYISNKEIAFSRIKSFVEKTNEETTSEKISYFLYRDIGFSVEEIAGKLNISVRTLQRLLKKEGTGFRHLKEEIRKALSMKYLRDANLCIQEVSTLLAYSERSAFEKAFKSWYGVNPSEYKKGLT